MFWAHTGEKWQPLRDHLVQVGELAERLALEAGSLPAFAKRARACGLLHDLGKYTNDFQKLLRGEVKKAPHSIFGAAAAALRAKAVDVGFAIAGHHAGMPDRGILRERVEGAEAVMAECLDVGLSDCPELAAALELPPLTMKDPFELDVSCRMLLSCLVDADRLNTAAHAGEVRAAAPPLDPGVRLERLLAAIETRAAAMAEGAVKRARRDVLDACLAAAGSAGGVYSLTVPTGGGKTFAGMAFALRRAVLKADIRRVIVVIPFLSILEQNARAYHEALGEGILEHHSGAFGCEDAEETYTFPVQRVAEENWDAPIVVTTSVRFFESLFSNHPRDLRRMHNIARSVVILDEVQTLPRKYVEAALSMMNSLARNWEVTFVFSTATQPALERRTEEAGKDPRWAPRTLIEIAPDPPRLFSVFKRVETEWRTGAMGWAEVARGMAKERQALAVVNTRGHALKLFRELERLGGGAVHLSNNMCPAHRLQTIGEIRERLSSGERCLVAATQLVEAGVDLDFPVVWRAMGPLDSIAQAAGRCDREGKLTERLGHPGGRLVVFDPEEPRMPPGVYREAAGVARAMFEGGERRWDEPGVIRGYFDRLYQSVGVLDVKGVQEKRREFQFKAVAAAVSWIEDDPTKPVLVPLNDDAKGLIERMKFPGVSVAEFRQAQRYTVNLFEQHVRGLPQIGELNLWRCPEGMYDLKIGFMSEGRDDVI